MRNITRRIRATFITLGIASGMTAAALAYLHGSDACRSIVLDDLQRSDQFRANLAAYTGHQDFLTTISQ